MNAAAAASPSPCPECGGVVELHTDAETETTIFRQGIGRMPYLETVRRPATVGACNSCEFVIEVKKMTAPNDVLSAAFVTAARPLFGTVSGSPACYRIAVRNISAFRCVEEFAKAFGYVAAPSSRRFPELMKLTPAPAPSDEAAR